MVSCSEKYGAIITPKILYYNNKELIWSAGGEISWNKGNTVQYGYNMIDSDKFGKIKEVEFSTGCCMLIPMDVFDKTGYMEEKYFLYYEDTDFCIKAKKNGVKIIYEPLAKMYHKVSASTGGKESPIYVYYINRNKLYFNKAYNGKRIYYIYITMGWVKHLVKWFIKGEIKLIKALFRAIRDYNNRYTGKIRMLSEEENGI